MRQLADGAPVAFDADAPTTTFADAEQLLALARAGEPDLVLVQPASAAQTILDDLQSVVDGGAAAYDSAAEGTVLGAAARLVDMLTDLDCAWRRARRTVDLDSHDPDEEVPLAGGDVTEGVVRVGDTVRRPQGPKATIIHDLFRHFESIGFDGSPRFIGVDERGREVLSFVHGEVAGRPRPPWIADESRLLSVARLLRRYDDAAAASGCRSIRCWRSPSCPDSRSSPSAVRRSWLTWTSRRRTSCSSMARPLR